MKKLILIAIMAITTLVAKAQVSYSYNEDHCWDIYERYIPNGYFDGPNGELIHYYGQGDFFVGYPKVYNPSGLSDYEFVVVHMDFRPLHRMVLSRGLAGLAAVHLSFDSGWAWSISYANVYYGGRHCPELHFFGNGSKWRYYYNLSKGYNYYDWDCHYDRINWRHNHRPTYYANFNNHHGDYRRYQYSGSSKYGYRMYDNKGRRERVSTVNQINPLERRRSSESIDNGRRLIEREIESSRRGTTTSRTETYVNGTRVDSERPDYRRGSLNGQTTRQRITTETETETTTTTNRRSYQRGSATQNYGNRSSSTTYQRGSATQNYGVDNSEKSSYQRGSATQNYGSGISNNSSRSKILYENRTSPRQGRPLVSSPNVRSDNKTTQRPSGTSSSPRTSTSSRENTSGNRR